MQFAGGKGKAWPSLECLAEEVALSVAQARRCVASLEAHGFIRRVARSGRSNEFEFLWHPVYATEPHSRMRAVPQSPVSGPGHSPVTARRESSESSSIKEIQIEENQSGGLHRRRNDLDDPEAELMLRLKERHDESVNRHAILQCVLGDLKTFSDLKPFLQFERNQTTAPDKLRNPAGHYRRTVQRSYEAEAKRRDWNRREQMRVLQAKIGRRTDALQRPVCTLGQCNGTGEVYYETGVVSACDC